MTMLNDSDTEARIVALLNDHNEPIDSGPVYRLVINEGAGEGVSKGSRYLIYSLGPEMTDPITGSSLGRLEIVKGSARVIHVQEKVSVVRTEDTREETQIVGRNALIGQGVTERITVAIPFRSPAIGDYARPI